MNFRTLYHVARQMGPKYVWFRGMHEVKRKMGALRSIYPVDPDPQRFITLKDWRDHTPSFFFESRESLDFQQVQDPALKERVENIHAGKFSFFNGDNIDLGTNYNWLSNPLTGYTYDPDEHWTLVRDLDPNAGDIKYVWEKSRFCFLYDIIRYDYHFQDDQAEWVWSEMESWMDANPINCGPHFKCSQEIALRCLNWTFALYYYRNSDIWTEERFARLMHYIYWQLKHVASNIKFSLISVRNNHAITEVSALYIAGFLFPFFPEAKTWWKKGKEWLEQEIRYQIYEDGSYLQHSHNYHRVALQGLTWVLYLSRIYDDSLTSTAQERIRESLEFLRAHMIRENGRLPNYGANDGALFFPLNSCDYRDYRPLLNTLYFYFEHEHLYPEGPWQEDAFWFSGATGKRHSEEQEILRRYGPRSFSDGGYYVLRKQDSLLSLRCARHKDRPPQADNLHFDLWYKGENVFRDAGSYQYNTKPFWIGYFNGTAAHNTVTLGGHDQMEKGPRFIWLNWSQAEFCEWKEEADRWTFIGRVNAFKQLGKYNTHSRKVQILKREPVWIIEDQMAFGVHFPVRQHWHPGPAFEKHGFEMSATEATGKELTLNETEGWHSSTYGQKEPAPAWFFESNTKKIRTVIRATL